MKATKFSYVYWLNDGSIYSVLIIGRLVEINNQFYTLPIHWQQKRLAIASLLYIKRLEVKQVFAASSNPSQRCTAANLFASLSHMAD